MSDSSKKLAFQCDKCSEQFRTSTYEHEGTENFAAECPACGNKKAPLITWQANLVKAWSNATGPKDTKITRFNAISHGLTAKVAQFHPARPGQYDACDHCDWLNNGCGEDGNTYCLKRTEIFMRHRLAQETGEIQSLKELFADSQAGTQIILENMMIAILQDGVRVHEPLNYTDKSTGEIKLVDYLDEKGSMKIAMGEMRAHPLLKPYIELLQKNNMSLADMMLTQKQQGEDAKLDGFLQDEQEAREEARKRSELFEQRQRKMLELVSGDKDPLSNVKQLGKDG